MMLKFRRLTPDDFPLLPDGFCFVIDVEDD